MQTSVVRITGCFSWILNAKKLCPPTLIINFNNKCEKIIKNKIINKIGCNKGFLQKYQVNSIIYYIMKKIVFFFLVVFHSKS